VNSIVNLCPVYDRPSKRPSYLDQTSPLGPLPLPDDLNQVLLDLLTSPTLADKEWVFRQYDHMVQTNTVLLPGGDASVIRIKGTKKALAITLDGNPLYSYLDPKSGGKIAIAEACRNLSCVGAYPVGVTNCLNFGNPEKPEIMWQFTEVIEGISEACQAFDIPITGGNVSFYNETDGGPIHPTPVLGIVGIIPDRDKSIGPGFTDNGEAVILLGENKDEIGGTAYLKSFFKMEKGRPPQIDLEEEKQIQKLCLKAIEEGLLSSAHDISEGGLALCLFECAFHSPKKIGCAVNLSDNIRADSLLFGETQSRILVTTPSHHLSGLLDLAKEVGVVARKIGETGGTKIKIGLQNETLIDLDVQTVYKAWKQAIPAYFKIR
ncbi:MAG: AIR synthase related protein, partial [Candidatus Aminicenantes bacterium]|nr:AIR synthase related protein [Candidatus Aminicenantes bacterium]